MARMWVVAVVVAAAGCSSKKPDAPPPPPSPTAPATPPAAPVAATAPDCGTLCKKTMQCLGVTDESQTTACTASCAATSPDPDKLAAMVAGDCAQLLAALQNAGAQQQQQPQQQRAGCAADCRGCVGDNSSCYAVAGGANGIPCDPCCCAPGGPAPVWRTDDQ